MLFQAFFLDDFDRNNFAWLSFSDWASLINFSECALSHFFFKTVALRELVWLLRSGHNFIAPQLSFKNVRKKENAFVSVA